MDENGLLEQLSLGESFKQVILWGGKRTCCYNSEDRFCSDGLLVEQVCTRKSSGQLERCGQRVIVAHSWEQL
jgi:hypothetical protein